LRLPVSMAAIVARRPIALPGASRRSRYPTGRGILAGCPGPRLWMREMAKEKGVLAARLRELRAERGLTQKAAAEHIGVAPGTLGALERDKQRPSAPTLAKLAAAYGVLEGELEEACREDALRPYKELPENWKRFTENMMKLKRSKKRAEWEEYQEQVHQLVMKHRLTERR
jgi:transcriptional regulator with XRE-family HTH domain